MAHRALPNSRYVHDAQILDRDRSNDGANPDDHVHEKLRHAGRRVADFAVRGGAAQSRRAPVAVIPRQLLI